MESHTDPFERVAVCIGLLRRFHVSLGEGICLHGGGSSLEATQNVAALRLEDNIG